MTLAEVRVGRWGLSVVRADGSEVVSVVGEVDGSTSPELRAVLFGVVASLPGRDVLVDMAGVSFCDASGLAVLIAAHRRAVAGGGRVVLVSPQEAFVRILSITGLDRVLQIDREYPLAPPA